MNIMLRVSPAVLILSILLTPLLLNADVTLTYKLEATPSPGLPPALAQALTSRLAAMMRDKIIFVKNGMIHSDSGLFDTTVDPANNKITFLDSAHRRFATIPFNGYADEIAGAVSKSTPAAQSAMANVKMTSDSRLTGRTARIGGIQAEEHEFVLSISAPIGSDKSPTPVARVVIQLWMATAAEIAGNSALREFADSRSREFDSMFNSMDSDDVFGKLVSQFPGMAGGISSGMKEIAGTRSVSLRQHIEIFMPVLALLAERSNGAANPLSNVDPDAALLTTDEELTEISSAPIADSVFRIPEGFTPAPLAEIVAATKPAMPYSAAAAPNAGAPTPPSVIKNFAPVYTKEARAKKIEGAVVLSVMVATDGKAENIQIVRSLEPGLDQSAIEAVQKWIFKPGEKNGVPVKVRAQIAVNFKLRADLTDTPEGN